MGADSEHRKEERKLTTILCADVVGYSRLMSQDETATLNRLKETREIFRTFIDRYGGRTINMAGDGLIADFASVVNAVQCAIEIQNKLSEDNEESPNGTAMFYRIGLNLGDVLIEGDDIFGDGVNVASRLETMAPPGGICISGTVYDQVKKRLPQAIKFLGNKEVKNIADPIPVYSITLTNSPVQEDPPEREEVAESDRDAAIRRQVKREAAFYRLAITFGVISFFLFLINLVTSSDYWWFFWPAGSLALILALRAVPVFARGPSLKDWEEKKVSKLKNRRKSDT